MHNLRKAKAHNALIINILQNEAISPEGGGTKQKTDNHDYRSFALQGQMPVRHLGYAWPPMGDSGYCSPRESELSEPLRPAFFRGSRGKSFLNRTR